MCDSSIDVAKGIAIIFMVVAYIDFLLPWFHYLDEC